MYSDRELLELAAMAEGITLHAVGNGDGEVVFYTYPDMLLWNPLTDDGDALRLAVDLGLNIFPIASTQSGVACSAVGTGSSGRLAEAEDLNDTRAATRRAIVRAASAIGESMQ